MKKTNNKQKRKDPNRCLIKDETKKMSLDEMKEYIDKCEARYHASFKTDSCREIMASYYEWRRAKRAYYEAAGICRPSPEGNQLLTITDDSENDEINTDFNSLIQ